MAEFVYKDYIPANARILITYGKENSVKFSYPNNWTYRKAVWKRAFPTIAGFWIMIHGIPLFYFAFYIMLPAIIGFFLALYPFILKYYNYESTTTIGKNVSIGIFGIIIELTLVAYLFVMPAIITAVLARDKEKLSKWVPKLGYWQAKLNFVIKEVTYTSKDIVDNKVVLPVFGNVYINWQPTGDFRKYLEKIEIMEIPFNFVKRRFLLPFVTKKEYNEFVFRAVFFFNKTPKDGDMKVLFR